MQTGIGDSRTVDEEVKRKLISQENSLTDAIINHHGTMSQLVRDLALIIEQRININDLDFAVSEISTYITRQLRQVDCPFADLVRRVLPDKYKNPELAGFGKIGAIFKQIEESGGQLVRQPLGECSNGELESTLQFLKKAKNDCSDRLGTWINGKMAEVRAEALNRGINMDEETYRGPISSKDYRYDIPEYFGLEELNQEVVKQGNRWIAALSKFFNDKYPQRPAVVRQKAWKYANSIRTIANLYETINEDKWSGDKSFWFEREFYSIIQSKHDSGNSTMFPNTLCANCSKDVAEDPKDCVRMKHWRPSPTGFLCERCGGTEPMLRENTREQVGDKEAHVYRDAQDVLNYMPDYADVFIDYSINFKSPEIYSRKSAIAGEFSKSAIGGTEKMVISKKKNNNKQS